ncbi:MAG: T9SS type A sorting domain-containing protein [Bacteroidota bacterium]|jgi:hypothetical protein
MNKRQSLIILSLLLSFAAKAQFLSFDKTTVLSNAPTIKKTIYCANGDLLSVFTGSSTLPNAFTVIRYDTVGNLIWHSDFRNQSVYSCSADDVIESSNGDLVISFSAVKLNFTSSASGLIRITGQGGLLWERLYSSGSMLSDQFIASSKLAEASDGSIYLALADINVSLNPTTEALILFRFSASGNLLWGKSPGAAPPMSVIKLMEAPGNGVHIGASNNLNGNIHLIAFDSSGLVTSSKKFIQAGYLTDFVTDTNHVVAALLTTDSVTYTRLIELNGVGNVISANEASISITSWGTDLLRLSGGYVSGHQVSGGRTMLCSWSASPSLNNGIAYFNSAQFTAIDFFEGNDGGIYIAGTSVGNPQSSKTRIIKTKPMLGNNFPFDGCSQVAIDFTILSGIVNNPIAQALIVSAYTPVTETSSFQVQAVSCSVTDNCSGVSVGEIGENAVKLYPNPASDWLIVSGEFNSTTTIQLFNNIGQEVSLTSVQRRDNELRINVNDLSNGIYMLHIIDADGRNLSTKLIIVH